MKTANKDIDIYSSYHNGMSAFWRCKVPCQLLKGSYGDYFIDRSKLAIKEWPKLYTLIKEK